MGSSFSWLALTGYYGEYYYYDEETHLTHIIDPTCRPKLLRPCTRHCGHCDHSLQPKCFEDFASDFNETAPVTNNEGSSDNTKEDITIDSHHHGEQFETPSQQNCKEKPRFEQEGAVDFGEIKGNRSSHMKIYKENKFNAKKSKLKKDDIIRTVSMKLRNRKINQVAHCENKGNTKLEADTLVVLESN